MRETKEFLLKNMAIIEQRWPNIRNMLEEASELQDAYLDKDVPHPTLIIDGIHLSSGYNPLSEARLQASLVPEGSACAWVYGMGNGHLPRALLERHEIERLVVVLMNTAVAEQSLGYIDQSDWLSDSRVELVTAENEEDIHFPFGAVPSCLQLASDSAARLRDLVFLELATPYIQARHKAQDGDRIQRLRENLDLIRSDGDVAELFGTKQGETIIVAAAGPTLDSQYEWLSEQHGEHILIAADAALKPLVEAGIFPDVVVTIDPYREGIHRFFSSIQLDVLHDKFLVYFPVVHRDVLKLWAGRRLVSYSGSAFYKEFREQYPKGMLFSSGSVVHPSVDLAVRMGAARIALLGVDLSFPGGNSHVAGSPAFGERMEDPGSHWVLNGHGIRVPTAANLRGYLRDLERYIAKCPSVQFINGSREGAFIQGTSYMEQTDDGKFRTAMP